MKTLASGEVSLKPYGLNVFNIISLLLIVYVQFQNILGVPLRESSPQLSHAIFLVDKVFLFSLFLFIVYKRLLGKLLAVENRQDKKYRLIIPLKDELILFIALIIFILWCLISAAINQNSLGPTLFGIFSYIVYFFVFFIFSSIPYKKDLIKKSYIFLLNFSLILSLLSIFQVVLSFIYPGSVHWWPNIQHGDELWRLGFFRAPSLLGHPNSIGMFALFFWTIELAQAKNSVFKKKWINLVILGIAILLSWSRTAISAALIAPLLIVFNFRKMAIFSVLVIFFAVILFYPYLKGPYKEPSADIFSYDEYRKFALDKSLKIWKDHPFFGVGPGMYGGHISIRFKSPIYYQYGFTGQFYDYLHNRVGSIEQQWAQALAELGIGGTVFFLCLMFTPYFILKKRIHEEQSPILKAIATGLMVMPFQMCFIYMISFTVTQQQQWLVPYFAFVGMLVGAKRRDICIKKYESTINQ